jgi:NitT/TauT family transport system permease protein
VAVTRVRRRSFSVNAWRVALLLAFLAAWEWVPVIPGVAGAAPFLDRFFISSPSSVLRELGHLVAGSRPIPGVSGISIWPFLETTLVAALIGAAVAVAVGTIGGLVCASSETVYDVVRPFIVALNAIPRIALVPVIVLVFGTSTTGDALTAFLLVVFLVFYNALEGARSVNVETIEFVRLFGASRLRLMVSVRAPYALAWVFACLPNAVSFGLLGAVAAELFTGSVGLGQLLTTAVDTTNASLTFAVVVILAVLGSILVQGLEIARRRWLGWWTVTVD